jgi:hypothetical protein
MLQKTRILVGGTIVILSSNMTRQHNIETRTLIPPLALVAHLEPFDILIEHRANDVNEGLVRVQETVTTCQ